MAQQNGTIDVQCKNTGCTAQKHCTCIRAFKYNKKKEHKSVIEKKNQMISSTSTTRTLQLLTS